MKKKLLLLSLIALFGLAACSSPAAESVSTPPATETAAATAEEPQKEEVKEKTEFSREETIKIGDTQLKILQIETSDGSDFDKPKSGHEYVIVTVGIENVGQSNISYNPFDYQMSNSQGQITDGAFTTIDSDTSLQSGELAPGGKVSGTLVFEQPKDDAKLQLLYKENMFSDESVKINMQ